LTGKKEVERVAQGLILIFPLPGKEDPRKFTRKSTYGSFLERC
jgi:hypothetical protein